MSSGALTNEQLVEAAGATVVGTPSGLKAQMAQAELSKRLIEGMSTLSKSIDANNVATDRFNGRTIQLTRAMAVLAVIQVVVAVMSMLK